jgi:hypothetical protein
MPETIIGVLYRELKREMANYFKYEMLAVG